MLGSGGIARSHVESLSVTQHPLHRSVQARLTHTASALGNDDQTLAGVWVADFGSRKPVIHQAVHATPGNVALTAQTQGAVPQPGHFPSECHEARTVVWYTKVTRVSADHSLETLGLLLQPRHPDPPTPCGAGQVFRGAIPGPHAPLSTLPPHPYEYVRSTQGRRSWLSFQRMKLSFTTLCRFLPAHRRASMTSIWWVAASVLALQMSSAGAQGSLP